MKTAISIPDMVFASADKLANRLGQSRSQLYTQAIKNYLEKHGSDKITRKLNEIYDTEGSRLDPGLGTLQSRSLSRNDW